MMDDASLTSATFWFPYIEAIKFWAEVGVVACLAVGVIADRIGSPMSKRIEHARELQIATLQKDGEAAKAAIADANARALEAQLALEMFRWARSLKPEQQQRIAEKLKPFAGTAFDAGIGPRDDPEPLYLLRSIHSALLLAGWVAIPWTGPGDLLTEPPMPAIGETSVTNVIIDVHPDHWAKLGAAATALANALASEGIAAIADSKPTTINTEAVHIRIGRKL